jgi:hypothetical protein
VTKIHLEDMWWNVSEGDDCTYLPTETIIDINMEAIIDQDEFWDKMETVLEQKFHVRPQGFKYTIITDTIH